MSINVVEDLTTPRAKLAAKARQAQSEKKILGTWTAYGRVKVRLGNRDVVELKTEEDLEKILQRPEPEMDMEAESFYLHQRISPNETTFHAITTTVTAASNKDPVPAARRPDQVIGPKSPNPDTSKAAPAAPNQVTFSGYQAADFPPLLSNTSILKPAILNVSSLPSATVNLPLTRQFSVQKPPQPQQMLTPRPSHGNQQRGELRPQIPRLSPVF